MASKGDTRLLDRLVAQAQGKAGPISAADFDFPKPVQKQPQPLGLPTATTSGNTASRMPKTVNLAELPLSQSMLSRKKTLPLAQMLVPQIGWSDETYKLLNKERPKNIGGINTDAEFYGNAVVAGVQGGIQDFIKGIGAYRDKVYNNIPKVSLPDETAKILGMDNPIVSKDLLDIIRENPKTFEATKSQKKYQEELENATGVNRRLGQVAYGVGNMIPSIASQPAGLGLVTMGFQGAGGAYDQAKAEGKSENEALAYATLTGVTSAAMQKLLGGIDLFDKNILSKTVGKQLNQLVSRLSKNPTVQKAFAQAGNMASEGIEEYIQAVLDPVFRNITFDENNAIDPLSMDKIEQGLLGMAISGVLNAGTSVARRTIAGIPRRRYTPAQQQKVIQEYPNTTDGGVVENNLGTDLAVDADPMLHMTKKEVEQQPPVNGLQLPEMATEVNLNSSIRYDEDSVKSLLDISAAKDQIHTPEQQKVIQEYQNATDEELVKFAKVVQTFPDQRAASKMEYILPPVAPKLAADIKEATGIDASGFQNSIKGNAVEHILKRHGENGQHDHSMANLADLGRIQYVLGHYDSLKKLYHKDGRPNLSREFKNTDGNPAQLILLKKRINGTFYLVEAVPDSAAKKLQVVSAYIQKRKEGAGQVPDAKAPGLTAKTVLTSTPSPFMLPQEALPVKGIEKERAGQAPDVGNTTPGMTPKSDLATTPISSLAQESAPVNSSLAINPAISSNSAQNSIKYANKPAWQAALQRNEGKERAVPKLADIVERIRETYHIPISTGKVTHRKALGQYRGKGETIRIRTTNDIPTIAHELGHHLDKQKRFSRGPYQELLIDRLPPEFKANYSQDELAGEGFAEFMRQYLADRETAKENYGEFYEAFRASFAPPELQALDSIANDINRYMTAKIREKMQAATASRLEREKSGGLQNMLQKFYRAFTEGNLSVKEFVDAYEAENGKLSGSKDPYKLITNAAYNDMITKTLIETGFYDAKGRKIEGALSLADALQDISEKEWSNFNLYLMLRHAKEWLSPLPDAEGKIGEPKRVFADDTLNDIATVNLQIRELERESPHFREASEKIYTYLRNLMQYWGVESGLISQDKAYHLWQIYPDYVPFFRQIETKGKGKGPKRGYANQSAPIARAKGSGAAIYNPIENIIYQTDKFVKAAKYNQVMQAIHNMVRQSDDLGWYLEKVPPDMVPHEVQVADVLKTLRNQVGDKDGQLTDLIDEFLDDTITRFTVAAPKNDIVTVMVDGKRHYYKVHDKDLLKVLTQMDSRQLNEIVRAVNVLTRFFTTFVTGRNPFFSFTSNIWRDFPTAYINGSQGNLFAFGAGIANAYKEQITHSEAFKQYEAMGGGGFVSPISQNRNELRRLIREIQKEDKTKAERLANWIFHPIEAIERLSDIAETAPRFNEFTHVLEKTGDLNEAFYAANEVTTNFRRHGNVGRQINAFVPFFNAAVQGIDKYRRVMTGEGSATKAQRAKYASAAFGRMMVSVVLPSLLAMAWNKDYDDEDDKQYPKLSSYMKNNYWNFALGDGKFFSIPKPREYAVFANVMERAIEKEWMDNEEAFRGFGEYLKDTFFPPGIPQGLSFNDFLQAISDVVLVGSIVDVGRNEDFAGRPVVSEGMKRLPDEQQYNDKTSLLAKTIGQATGTSPMVLDFMIKQNAGVFGTLNAAFTANPAERDFTFGTKNKFIRDAVYSTDILNHFYDDRDKYVVQYNGDKRNGQKAAKAYAYDKMASFLSETSALSKENPDASREIRKEMRDMTDSFQKRRSLAIDTELQRIYQNTDCDREIFRDYAAKRKISASKKKESYTAVLDFQQLASYQKAIDKAIREAYQKVWNQVDYPIWEDSQRAEAFIKAKKKAVNEVKWEFVKKYGEKE